MLNNNDSRNLFFMLSEDFQEMYVLLKCVCQNEESTINKDYFHEKGMELLNKWMTPSSERLEKIKMTHEKFFKQTERNLEDSDNGQ